MQIKNSKLIFESQSGKFAPKSLRNKETYAPVSKFARERGKLPHLKSSENADECRERDFYIDILPAELSNRGNSHSPKQTPRNSPFD